MPSADIAMDGVYAENAGAFFGLLLNHLTGYPARRYRLSSVLLVLVDEACTPGLLKPVARLG